MDFQPRQAGRKAAHPADLALSSPSAHPQSPAAGSLDASAGTLSNNTNTRRRQGPARLMKVKDVAFTPSSEPQGP